MLSLYYEPKEYIISDSIAPDQETLLNVNGFKITKPLRFKTVAHERAFEIALVLASKEPTFTHTQRMGDIIIKSSAPVILTTSECIDVIMFNGHPDIQLKLSAKNPNKVAHDAMELVPIFFDNGRVKIDRMKQYKKMWYLWELQYPSEHVNFI